jgi:hypothetical protein
VRRLAPLLLLLLTGCLYQPHDVTPPPNPPVDSHAAVAESAGRDYLRGLAAVGRDVAGRADTFKSNVDVYEAVQKESDAAQKAAFRPLADAENALVKPDGEYNAAAVRAMLTAEAEGFERAAGGAR